MKNLLRVFFCIFICSADSYTQNEKTKWYFGANAGLDFMTSPPTILTNGALNTNEGCASIANSAGSLLFYTDGATVWNQLHQVMANGTGLLGNGPQGTMQAAIIAKKPGSSTLFYIFTLDDVGGPNGLRYSVVDMSLAAGNGSITVKNTMIYAPSSEKMTGVRHCNGIDWWIVTHEYSGDVFRAYLLTANGLSTTPVLSSAGAPASGTAWIGRMKISPDGKKLIMSSAQPLNSFELFNFDIGTGIVTYSLALYIYDTGLNAGQIIVGGVGCEFSPDGTKLYTARWNGAHVYQWDLCAGSMAAIQSSSYTILPNPAMGKGGIQLAPDGKLYLARWFGPELGVVNNPNGLGALCNYSETGQPLTPNTCNTALPNFLIDFPKPAPSNFTPTISNCFEVSFSSPTVAVMSFTNCATPITSLVAQAWDFGEPGSGTLNVSSSANPSHTYSAVGNYSVTLILYYSCGLANDTVRKIITISKPILVTLGKTAICKGNTTTITATGANSYTWSSGAQSSSIVITPTNTSSYTVVGTITVNGCSASRVATVTVSACTGIDELNGLNNSFPVFPNPSNGIFTIESQLPATVSVVNSLGQAVANQPINPGENKLDLSSQPDGIYLLELKDKTGIKKSKIVLSK